MLLLLIRHGYTARTGVKLSGWTPGIDLNKVGKAQADALVQRFEGVDLDAIYSSPLERCVQTGEPLARARGLRIEQRDELGEVRYGDIEGKSLKVLAKSSIWKELRAWPSDVRFPNGESLRETQGRAIGAIERLRAEHPNQVVAVFSHGDWIRLSMAHLMGVHIDLYRRLGVEPASVSAVRFHPWGPAIVRLNDTGSLADVNLSKRAEPRRGAAGRTRPAPRTPARATPARRRKDGTR